MKIISLVPDDQRSALQEINSVIDFLKKWGFAEVKDTSPQGRFDVLEDAGFINSLANGIVLYGYLEVV